MTTIVPTIHRITPKLVEHATQKSIWSPKSRMRRYRAMYSEEERQRYYNEAVAFNKKHGIDPRARGNRTTAMLALAGSGRGRNQKPITLPKVSI